MTTERGFAIGLFVVVLVVLTAWLWNNGALNWMLPASLDSPNSVAYARAADQRNGRWFARRGRRGRGREGAFGALAKASGRLGYCWVNTATGVYSAVRPPPNEPGWINRCNYL